MTKAKALEDMLIHGGERATLMIDSDNIPIVASSYSAYKDAEIESHLTEEVKGFLRRDESATKRFHIFDDERVHDLVGITLNKARFDEYFKCHNRRRAMEEPLIIQYKENRLVYVNAWLLRDMLEYVKERRGKKEYCIYIDPNKFVRGFYINPIYAFTEDFHTIQAATMPINPDAAKVNPEERIPWM